MQKRALALTAALLLAVTVGCAAPAPAAPEETPPAQTQPEETLYDCGGLEAAIPAQYEGKLVVKLSGRTERPWGVPLLDVYEKASLDAFEADYGRSEGVGFLFGIARLDQAAYEQHLVNDYGGVHPFARDNAGNYYAQTNATDVQFYRADNVIDQQSAEWKAWEELGALGDQVMADFTERNGLTPYDDSTFYDRSFTYDGDHAYVKYYNYYDFDGDKRMWQTLVLSQPAAQGEGGIWCVERFYDVGGEVYYAFPNVGSSAAEHYADLQAQCDAGERTDLLTPLGAALDFVRTGGWYNDETVTAESLAVTDGPDTEYFELNAAMRAALHSHTGAGLDFSDPDDPTIPLFLERLSAFTPDTWGVLGRYEYGFDWWTPIKDAVTQVAVGTDQESRDAAVMHLYLTVPGEPYRGDLAAILQAQRSADADAFDAAAAAFRRWRSPFRCARPFADIPAYPRKRTERCSRSAAAPGAASAPPSPCRCGYPPPAGAR